MPAITQYMYAGRRAPWAQDTTSQTLQWMLDHTALLKERITNREVGGLDVDVEAQNRFELRGKSATLAGRPDLFARRDD